MFRKRKKKEAQEILEQMTSVFQSEQDPNGGYTGTPIDGGKPIQDADDL